MLPVKELWSTDSERYAMEKTGRLAEIIFRNNENFYTVASVENDDEFEQFVVVGNMPRADLGMTYVFYGEWKNHSTYGEQFSFTNCTEQMPRSRSAITAFLSSGVIRGVNLKTAKSLVDEFGEDTLRVIAEEPERLEEVYGIGKKKAETIAESYRENREFADISLFFTEHGISSAYAMKMYKVFGAGTVAEVKRNPYRLISEIRGIGFKQADAIAEKLGVPRDSQHRIKSGILFTLRHILSDGSTYAVYDELCEKASMLLDVPMEDVDDQVTILAVEGGLRIAGIQGMKVIYPEAYYEAESNVARSLYYLNKTATKTITADVEGLIKKAESVSEVSLSDEQRDAVRTAVREGVCVITGGPGTGKTTIINTMLRVFEACGFDVALAAPTGRAAKRMSETTGHDATTVHRLLEYTFSDESETMHFNRDHSDPLEYDVIVVDEMSMVDITLMDALTDAILPGTRFVMVGDANQLPSVGAGNVLRDIIRSEMIETVKLTQVFRQDANSLISENAGRINRGEYPSYNGEVKDFFFMRKQSEQAVLATILELCRTRLPRYYTELDPMRDIQVLTPMHKGVVGTVNLNAELQQVLNPPSHEKAERQGRNGIFRVGDKVMQLKNNYTMEWKRTDDFSDGTGVFNGDIGFISSIDNTQNKLTVVFDDIKRAVYSFDQLEELDLAYAMTIHKSQGSEFPVMIMPICSFPPLLANRNLLYTAVTRGKKTVVLVGAEYMLHNMINNDRIDERRTSLADKLGNFINLESM